MTPAAAARPVGIVSRRIADYLGLGKPRIVLMVLVTTAAGYYLGSTGTPHLGLLVQTLLGTALAAAGTLALNQLMERDLDARMARTRHRPLPDGRLQPAEALVLGGALLVAGVVHLTVVVGPLPAAVTAAIAVVYLLLYTPLKRVTPLCSLVGAVPGALPPVAGWAAARGTLGPEPWVLFAILFFWQIPHSLAIGRLYRDDYARAGIRLLPVIDRDGPSTGTHVVAHCLALLPVALLPTLLRLAGAAYFVVALALGLAFLASGIMLARGRSAADARRLMFASLVYLPVLLAVMALDKVAF
ncbi:MAG: protoheme IX farnesyltransferase [Deltaproteobacteria bacterium 13_1_40CM_3_71_4]|nr:MAG: protoheme IX farnesyltransferase [Deltaproteobacteria bacterium 13_1_40CM_3_71_4]